MSVEEVERAMRGDHDAFAALVARPRTVSLRSPASSSAIRTGPDATQEAFVHAWRELPRLRDPDRFDAWLRRLVVNACYDEARDATSRRGLPAPLQDVGSVDPTSAARPSPDRIDRAFRRLPLDQRTVLVLQHHGS